MPVSPPVPASAPPRVARRLREAVDADLRVVHAGPDAVYVDLDGRCVGVLSARAVPVPCGLRTRLDVLPPVRRAAVRDGVLHLADVPVTVGRLTSVDVPRVAGHPSPLRAPVASLVGAGDGLTPYGDDVLCGWIAAHRAVGAATPEVDAEVRRLLSRTTLLSATLLDCALHGEALPVFAAYLRARGNAGEPAAEHALRAVGGSSGSGLLEGARWALVA